MDTTDTTISDVDATDSDVEATTGNVSLHHLSIDASVIAPYAVTAKPSGAIKLLTAKKGLDVVLAEIRSLYDRGGSGGGVSLDDLRRVLIPSERIEEIDSLLPQAMLLVHILVTTRAMLEHERQRAILALAALVDLRAEKFDETGLLSRYGSTREYRSAVAKKGVKTRRRKAAAAAAAQIPGGADAAATAPAAVPKSRNKAKAGTKSRARAKTNATARAAARPATPARAAAQPAE